MTEWSAPQRADVLTGAGEREMLQSWLDWHRTTLLIKAAGLSGSQLCARSCPPSTLSLLGLVRHMAEVERGWFISEWHPGTPEIYCTPDDQEADFERTDPTHADSDLATYLAEVEAAKAEAAKHELDEMVENARTDGSLRRVSLRWIYLHLIEEYARHNGHADLLREAIDGNTGP